MEIFRDGDFVAGRRGYDVDKFNGFFDGEVYEGFPGLASDSVQKNACLVRLKKDICMKKKCYIISGANGAGKTTFAYEFLPIEAECLNFINADLILQGNGL